MLGWLYSVGPEDPQETYISWKSPKDTKFTKALGMCLERAPYH